jgi:hypothetical protein
MEISKLNNYLAKTQQTYYSSMVLLNGNRLSGRALKYLNGFQKKHFFISCDF